MQTAKQSPAQRAVLAQIADNDDLLCFQVFESVLALWTKRLKENASRLLFLKMRP